MFAIVNTFEQISRLQHAVEGVCDGLALSNEQAARIVVYMQNLSADKLPFITNILEYDIIHDGWCRGLDILQTLYECY
jgi:hypothetical protein